MVDARGVLRAGGIVPVTHEVPSDERTGVLRARRYVHPALPGRVVIRLSADVIAPGADIEMKTLGFERPTASEPLGRQRFRALGFPGWALVHDPKRAKFALEVMQEFKRAAARVKSKPGHARDAFVAIADRLGGAVPHFLPSFWEEAGRAFLAEGNTAYGAQSFEKARQVELEHRLPIDEAVRGEVFLEFALGGALTVKSISAYGKELERTLGAPEAYPRFSELALRRTLGGMPPWTGMAKDLRALAKAAKLNCEVEDERFLAEILEASSITKASSEFWGSYRDVLLRLARKSETTRARLLHLFPTPGGKDFPGWWLDLLLEAGAVDLLESAEGRNEEGTAARWLAKMLGYAPDDRRLIALLERLAPRIRADGEPLQVVHGRAWAARADIDVCERAFELAIAVADPPEMPVPFRSRANSPFILGSGFRCDPVRVAADPRFAPLLMNAVATAMGKVEFEKASRGKAGVTTARRAWLADQVAQLSTGVIGMEIGLPVLEKQTNAATFAEFPDLRDSLAAVSPSAALAEVLRGGIFDELGWPALEAAVMDLGGPKGLRLGGAFPYLVVHSATKAIVVGPRGRALEHDLHVRAPNEPDALYFARDQLLVTFFDRSVGASRGYWSGAPHEVFSIEAQNYAYLFSVPVSATLPDGSVTFGGRKVLPGDTQLGKVADMVADQMGFWVKTHDGGKLRLNELDPATGSVGRASWPSVVERSLSPGDEVVDLFLIRAEETRGAPLGSADGLVGAWTVKNAGRTECISVDGQRALAERTVTGFQATGIQALVRFPKDDRPRVATTQVAWNRGRRFITRIANDSRALGVVGDEGWYARGSSVTPPLPFWSLLTPRDEGGSGALRATTEAQAELLLAAANADREREDAAFTTTREKLDALFAEVTHPRLKDGIVGVTERAAQLASELGRLVKERLAPGEGGGVRAEDAGELDADAVARAIPLVTDRSYGRGNLAEEISAASRWLGGGGPARFQSSTLAWELWLGSVRALAVLLTSQAVARDNRDIVVRLLGLWNRSAMAGDLSRFRVARVLLPAESPWLAAGRGGQTSLASLGESRYFVRHLPNEKDSVVRVVERTNDGVFRLPNGATLVAEKRPAGCDDEAWLGSFLAELEHRGAPQWHPAAASALASRTGLSRAEATLLWAGLPGLKTYQHDFLGKELRAILGLKVPEAKAAADSFRKLGMETYLDLYSAAAPDDPRALWEPEGGGCQRGGEPGRTPGGRLERSLRRAADSPGRTRRRPQERSAGTPAARIDASRAPGAGQGAVHAAASVWRVRDEDGETFAGPTVASLARLVPYLFGALPVGDPYRSAIPRLVEAVRARLASPALILPLGQGWFGGDQRPKGLALMDAIGGESRTAVASRPNAPSLVRDNGAIILSLTDHGMMLAEFRPSRVVDYATDAHLRSVAELMYGDAATLRGAAFFSSPECDALALRIRETPVPNGHWEANPRLASAATVESARARLKTSEDAAVLYLQLLALPEPTNRNVRTWNAWDAGTLKAAAAELVARKLVVEGKRERAGREIFLPGGWDKAGDVEAWKRPLYGSVVGAKGTILPARPLHLLFDAAWKRIESGDRPAFEEV